ncbi:MAG: hypothetical protein A2020_09305 [Lentisphaerae bacterium GWF2_45_14]|uniref:Chemotaxis phosphatase CheX-like domain-containing protein n=1 Tax=Candidatus Magasanikbacteria bacterium GW2011_GWE2_42_7 TaxID=1619052 RepID=A0A0G1DJ00_9BACT|nr:MAG: hypothetical protein UV42_C0043G0003 [Candidatus Magasanikbacteria bacterium GW2011_GWE2_42_7]OGV39413.1 MAG: hypothetical protein A2020_09305 [Lentisphaerae bacterium GWF2_45_14]
MMDVKNVNAFTEVIVNTFETALNSKPFRCGDFSALDGDIRNPDDLMCIITFSGTLTGAIILTFPESTAKKVYAALMFEEAKSLSDELQEAFKEILNMVIGNVKAVISGQQIEFDEPMTAAGKKIKFENTDAVKWLLVPMSFKEWGHFSLYIGVK